MGALGIKGSVMRERPCGVRIDHNVACVLALYASLNMTGNCGRRLEAGIERASDTIRC